MSQIDKDNIVYTIYNKLIKTRHGVKSKPKRENKMITSTQKNIVKVTLNAWKKEGQHRLYVKVLDVADSRFNNTFDDECGYIDVKTGEVKFHFHAFTTVNQEMIIKALDAYIAHLKETDDEDWDIEFITSATLKIEV